MVDVFRHRRKTLDDCVIGVRCRTQRRGEEVLLCCTNTTTLTRFVFTASMVPSKAVRLGLCVLVSATCATAALHASESAQSTPHHAGNTTCSADEFEHEAAFNSLPWNIPVARALAFVVNPLSTLLSPAPTYPLAWAGRPEWKYWRGLGVISVIEYADTPVGPYSELIYTVGFYKSECKAWAPNSILRIWVDSSATCDAAHRIWGIPKEMASFQWHETNNTLGVTVTDAGSGEVLFKATAKDTFAKVNWFSALLPTSRQTVHWPIDANKQRPVAVGTVPAYKVAEAALAEGKALTTTMHVDYTGSVVNTARSVFINQDAFTGRKKQRYPLQVLGVGVSFKSGDANPVWSISEPSVC